MAIDGHTAEKRPKTSNKAKELVPYDFMKLLTNENLTDTLTLDQVRRVPKMKMNFMLMEHIFIIFKDCESDERP